MEKVEGVWEGMEKVEGVWEGMEKVESVMCIHKKALLVLAVNFDPCCASDGYTIKTSYGPQ